MEKYRCTGAITVFLSLVGVLVLSLICTLAESARVQGARAQASAVTDMGLFSVFAEYDRGLLEDFDVLFLDGSYGSGSFEPERIALQLRNYMEYNIDPTKGLNVPQSFRMFPMSPGQAQITDYALATDGQGAVFYNQAVRNLKENLGSQVLRRYLEHSKDAQKQDEDARNYEQSDREIEKRLEELEEERAQKEEDQNQEGGEETAAEPGDEENVQTEPAPVTNPLDTIKRVKEMGILELVVRDTSGLSEKKVDKSQLSSVRELNRGSLDCKKDTGIADDAVFQEYLLEHFSCMPQRKQAGYLDYQIEYILAGKDSDIENLKSIVHRLLLLREGVNFAYAVANADMRKQAGILAAALTAGVGIPGLTTAVRAALLLAWAYGESLLDVRTLLAGGKIPLAKTADTWKLSLENLGNLETVLTECDQGGGKGQSYVDYLRILLCLGGKDKYPLRALDMVEGVLKEAGQKNTRADYWVAEVQVQVQWEIIPVFLRVPAVFLGVNSQGTSYSVSGGLAY